jgi:hypothetical protein
VFFDLARRHVASVQGNDSFREVADRGLALGHNLGIEVPIAIPRRFDVHLTEITANGFRRGAVPGVAATAAFGAVLGVAQVLLHFHFQEGFHHLLHQVLNNGLGIEGLAPTPGADLSD